MMMWRYGNGYWGGGGAFVMAVFLVLWWVLVIGALFLVVRWLFRHGRAHHPGGGYHYHWPVGYDRRDRPAEYEDPLAIIKRRYASGELTREQFEEMREALLR